MVDNIILDLHELLNFLSLRLDSHAATFALLVSLASLLLSYRVSRQSLRISQEEAQNKKKRLRLEVDNKLYEAFYLMGEDLEMEAIQTFSNFENLHKAKRLLEDCIILAPTDSRVYSLRGDLRSALKKYDLAEKDLRTAIKLQSGCSATYNSLGMLFTEIDRLNEAEENFRIAINLSPNVSEFHFNLGNVLSKLERLDEAEVAYIKSMELSNHPQNIYLNLGLTLFRKGQSKRALEVFIKAESVNPSDPKIHLAKGILYSSINKQVDAYHSLKSALELEPNNYITLALMGEYHLHNKNYEKAIEYLEKSAKISPYFANNQISLAFAFFANGQDERAILHATKAVEFDPENENYKTMLNKINEFSQK